MGKLAPLSRRVLPYRARDLLTIHLTAGEGYAVTYSHRSRRFDYSVYACTGEQTGTAESYRLTDRELEAHPIVLEEPTFLGVDYHIHPEPPLVEAALGPKLA